MAYEPAEAMIGSFRAWASAVGLWNLALDPAGGPVQQPNRGCPRCTGIVAVDEQTHAVTYGLNYYQLGQVSKFVSPGAVRIASNSFVSNFRTPTGVYGATPGLDDVAFRNPDGSIALVADNSSGSRLRFVVAADGRSFRYALPPRTTATFVWRLRCARGRRSLHSEVAAGARNCCGWSCARASLTSGSWSERRWNGCRSTGCCLNGCCSSRPLLAGACARASCRAARAECARGFLSASPRRGVCRTP